jgi:hypothetical protein
LNLSSFLDNCGHLTGQGNVEPSLSSVLGVEWYRENVIDAGQEAGKGGMDPGEEKLQRKKALK